MTKDEWYNKISEWAEEDGVLKRLPFMFYVPLAEKLEQNEAAELVAKDKALEEARDIIVYYACNAKDDLMRKQAADWFSKYGGKE